MEFGGWGEWEKEDTEMWSGLARHCNAEPWGFILYG